ncbi:hypothetical protein BX616_010247 [Lobosporangium transversale]|nr:hypothetical protein BX616_010247 [Lobosporangium transversale]
MPVVPSGYQVDQQLQSQHPKATGTGTNTTRTYHDTDYSSTISPSKCTSRSSSKQSSPAPSIMPTQSSNRGSPALTKSTSTTGSKGKLFQCTGFGDCRMVFTRSEHLARHARKHTGEKPFQCVVDGCTRMFSRFDNMVQHTQTHTKGSRRESVAGIASKIAIESRRKSEAGLLGSQTRGASKVPRSKRNSVSSTSGRDSQTLIGGRRSRVNSLPGLSIALPTDVSGDRDHERIVPKKGSSTGLEFASTSAKISLKDKSKLREKSQTIPASKSLRRGSLESITSTSSTSSSTALSWYASKLHHRSSVDVGALGGYTYSQYGRTHGNLDAHLPPLNLSQYEYQMDCQPTHHQARHPLSPDRSLHSDEEEVDDDGINVNSELDYINRAVHHQYWQHHPWGSMVDSTTSQHLTLPPLRENMSSACESLRLPPISSPTFGYRSRSASLGNRSDEELSTNDSSKVRRLSLADLETPIYETKKVVDHSIQSEQALFEGVDVSEDEIHALEAFSELWSQGRDVAIDDAASLPTLSTQQLSMSRPPQAQPYTTISVAMKAEPMIQDFKDEVGQVVPGLDTGRRLPRIRSDSMFAVDTAMDLD